MAARSGVGAGLDGLVGGFLLGHDFSRQRRSDRMFAQDRARRIAQEDADRAAAAEDRDRTRIGQDIALRDQYGLAFGKPPKTPVEQLRSGVGDALITFDQMETPGARERHMESPPPAGTYRVGPSASDRAQERAERLRMEVGQQLGMSPDSVEAFHEFDLLDNLMGQGGGSTLQRFEHNGGQYTFNPADGSVSPISGMGGGQVQPRTGAVLDGLGLSTEERAFVEGLSPEAQEQFVLDRMDEATPPAPGPTDSDRRAEFGLARAERGHEELTELVQEFGGAPGITSMLGTGLFSFAKKEQVQRFNTAARAIVSAFLRVESGGAITDQEIRDQEDTFIPQPGDRPETVNLKLDILNRQMEALRNAAGRAGGPNTQGQPDGNPWRGSGSR